MKTSDKTCVPPQQQTFDTPELLQRLQMDSDVEELQGSMRFMGSLFREHLLPYALVHTLVSDLASHSEKARHILLRPTDPARKLSLRITLGGAHFHHSPCFRHVVRQVDTLFHVGAHILQTSCQVALSQAALGCTAKACQYYHDRQLGAAESGRRACTASGGAGAGEPAAYVC